MISEATGEAIAAAAAGLIGTGFRHQGRLPEYGMDCAGVVLWALGRAGVPFDWPSRYRMDPEPEEVLAALEEGFLQVHGPGPGDILAFRLPGDRGPKHLAVAVSGDSMVHVFGRGSRVRLDLTASWLPRLHSIWRRSWQQ